MQAAVDAVWPLVGELFRPHEVEARMAGAGIGVDPAALRAEFDAVLAQVLDAATLRPAGAPPLSADGDGVRVGRDGAHTEALAEILGEMQALARSLPGGVW